MEEIYFLKGIDNDTFYYDAESAPDKFCSKCKIVLDEKYINKEYEISKTDYDFSSAYDNAILVSEKFRDFCLRNNYPGLEFIEIKKSPENYLLRVDNVIHIDAEINNISRRLFCDACKRYRYVSLVLPLIFKNEFLPLKEGIYITDISFGSGSELSPYYVVNKDAYRKMMEEKFKGISFELNKQKFICC